MTTLFRKFLPAAVAVLLFFTLAALYFAPQFGGDVLPQHDVRQYEGASREIHRTREAYGEDPQWIGSMFGGMPAYLVDVRYPAQLVKDAAVPLTRAVPIPAGLIFFAMCAFWVMLRMMKIDPWVGIVPSLAYGLSTYFLLIIGAGHLTKMWALVYAPPMMGGIWMTLRGGRPGWGGALTALFASLEIGANHPQITYYFLLAAALFWLSEGIVALREKLLKPFAKRTAVLAAAGLLALGSNFAPLWYTAQHAKDTTRSGSELAAGDAGSGGLGLACAALNPELIDRAAILYPFLSDFKLVWDLGADEIAYEGLRYYARWFDADEHQQDRWFRQLGYIDSKNFAPMVRCPVLFGTGLDDVICPPQTQCAVYNNLHCAKKRYLFPGYGHEEIPEFDDMLLGFFTSKEAVL